MIKPYYNNEVGLSFPSAHTSLAFNTATVLSLRYNNWYITTPVFLWASCVGYSRLKLGEHYPTDVLEGSVIGLGSAYMLNWIYKMIISQNKKILK